VEGDDTALAYGTHRLGCTMLVGDDVSEATKLFADAQQRYLDLRELNSSVIMADVELAIALTFQGDLTQAANLCRLAVATCELHGEQWARSYAIFVLALVALDRGQHEEAVRYGRDSLRLKLSFHDLLGMVLALEVLAWSAAAGGGYERAAVLLGAASQIWRSVGYPMFGSRYFGAPRRGCETVTREALGDHEYDTALQRGRAMTFDEAVRYALGEDTAEPDPAGRTVGGPVPGIPVPGGPVLGGRIPGDTGDTAATSVAGPEAAGMSVLTRRERQVAAEIAKGLSNKEIAARLLIAPRTAESHVERIIQKLGFSRRAQIAAWVGGRQRDAD